MVVSEVLAPRTAPLRIVEGGRSLPTPGNCAPPASPDVLPLDRVHQLESMLAVAGPGAVVSHAAAAHLWGFPEVVAWRAEVATP
ncbi:MAG: hypothetical protein ACOYN3_04880, partial [Acidimicrobiia bacterium]